MSYSTPPPPSRIAGVTAAWFAGTAAVVAILAALAIAAWQAGWWFTAQDTSRTDRVTQQGYANQSALHAQVGQEFSDIASLQRDEHVTPANVPFDQPSIRQDAGRICAQMPQFAPGYTTGPQWHAWERANCADGSLSAGSALNH